MVILNHLFNRGLTRDVSMKGIGFSSVFYEATGWEIILRKAS